MLEYFRDKIKDELCGGKEYIKMAIEFKSSHPAWGKMFVDMSAAELSHATNLYKMADEYYKEVTGAYKEIPKYMREMWDEIVTMYTDKSAEVKYMHDLYNR